MRATLDRMKTYNKGFQGGVGGGIGAALAQLAVIFGWVPPEAETALTIVLAAILGFAGPRFGPANK